MTKELNSLSSQTLALLLNFQKMEENGSAIYQRIAEREKDETNKATLLRIAAEEKRHAQMWQHYTGKEVKPVRFQLFWYTLLSYILGYTFVIKLMEGSEVLGKEALEGLENDFPEARFIMDQEQEHEERLIEILDEERLQYVGAMVLGLNDALVELTGTIAGLTFALANTRLVALSGIITGVSATLSMAASNYLAERADGNQKALKSSLYTGVAYLVTVVLMVLPFLLLPEDQYLLALIIMLVTVIVIIFCFTYYISVAKSLPFFQRFGEMAVISLSVAVISFFIGLLAKRFLGIDI